LKINNKSVTLNNKDVCIFLKNNVCKPFDKGICLQLCKFHVEMMGLIGMGNNPMVGATVACAVAVEQALIK